MLGGTHVRKKKSQIENLYCYFYRGKSLDDLTYFTTGPDLMKDVRLIDLQNGKIGVFSRPRSLEVRNKYGSDALIGFTTINSLDELDAEAISSATPIDGLFAVGEWGGCNQAYLLENGNIGIIGHHGYRIDADDGTLLKAVYSNTAFELNPETREVPFYKIIGTRSCFPPAPPKFPMLSDCTFTSGIVLREDGKADLYAGIGDTQEGRLVIEYPFSSPVRPAAGIA
ncbi:MAG: DUF1861 family protein [Clostridiales bacterium]|nr:DUF1861 family protein [Clostridiales bacterium]